MHGKYHVCRSLFLRSHLVLCRKDLSVLSFNHERVWDSDRVDGFDLDSGLTPTGNQKIYSTILACWFFFSRRKFFTFIMTWNIIGLILTISGAWTYPRRYTSAFILGNLLTAILVRNELFGRFLYLLVNALFAKVGFRLFSFSTQWFSRWPQVASVEIPFSMHICFTASRWDTFGMCDFWIPLANVQSGHYPEGIQEKSYVDFGHGSSDLYCRRRLYSGCNSLDSEHTS